MGGYFMKAKRIFALLLCLVFLCLTLCSCVDSGAKFTPLCEIYPDIEFRFNYNNCSAGGFSDIDAYGMYTSPRDNLLIFGSDGFERVYVGSYFFECGAQRHGDKIYLLLQQKDLGRCQLVAYDLVTEKKEKIAIVPDYWIQEFYVVDDHIYYEAFDGAIKTVTFGEETATVVVPDYSACGIVDGKLRYIIQDQTHFSVYGYDRDTGKSALMGEFETEQFYGYMSSCSFTSDSIIFCYDVDDTEYGLIVYNIESDTMVKHALFETNVWHGTAFEEYVYIEVKEDDYYDEKDRWHTPRTIYRMRIDTGELEKVVRYENDIYFSVLSDDIIYVEYPWDGTYKYHNAKTGETHTAIDISNPLYDLYDEFL